MIPHTKYTPHRRGTRFYETVVLQDEAGAAQDLTGRAFECHGREFPGSGVVLCYFAVVVVGDPLLGTITLELDSAGTLAAEIDGIATIAGSCVSIDAGGDPVEEFTFDLPLIPQT